MRSKSVIATTQNGPILQRKCACGSKSGGASSCPKCGNDDDRNLLRRKSTSDREVGEVPQIVYDVLRSPGQPLDAETRAFFEPRFGQDFSRVRVHHDVVAGRSAAAINAVAYAVGQHVVFRPEAYSVTSTDGRGILAHELTHVVQNPSSSAGFASLRIESDTNSTMERVANTNQAAISSGREFAKVVPRQNSSVIQRLPGSPAGGCGLCYGSPKSVGLEAHKRIQNAFKAKYGNRILSESDVPVLLPHAGDENGRLDLASNIGIDQHAIGLLGIDELAIGEIKPANLPGILQGDQDLFWYEDQLSALGIKSQRMILPPPIEPIPFPTLAPPNCPQFQNLFVDPPWEGVYTYWCQPDFAELIRTCKCNDRQRKPEKRVQEKPVSQPLTSPNPAPAKRPQTELGPTPQQQPSPSPSPAPTQDPRPEKEPGKVHPFPGQPAPKPENDEVPEHQPVPVAARWSFAQILTALAVIGLVGGMAITAAMCIFSSPTVAGAVAFCGLTAAQGAALMLILNPPSKASTEA